MAEENVKLPASGRIFDPPPAATSEIPHAGGLPLKPGKLLRIDPGNLTDAERAALQNLPDYKEGDPVPENLAEIMSQIQADIDHPPPPVPEDTPRLKVPEAVDWSSLSEAKQKELREFLDKAKMADAEHKATLNVQGEGVREAISGENVRKIELDDDLTTRKEQQEDKQEDKQPPTGEGESFQYCQHCGWDLQVADIPDPDDAVRQAYLEALLGRKPFTQQTTLFDGYVSVRFRELEAYELDAAHQVAAEKIDAKAHGNPQLAFLEQLARYRVSLQIVRLQIGNNVHNMPPSLKDWAAGRDLTEEAAAVIDQVYSAVFEERLRHESVSRLVRIACDRFNRLVAKLEACAERENFWKPAL